MPLTLVVRHAVQWVGLKNTSTLRRTLRRRCSASRAPPATAATDLRSITFRLQRPHFPRPFPCSGRFWARLVSWVGFGGASWALRPSLQARIQRDHDPNTTWLRRPVVDVAHGA